eukprot:1670966-Pyramimonas_sp.AAC.1
METVIIVFDQCQFGADFRNWTSAPMPSDFDDSLLGRKCMGTAGMWSRVGRPHEHLEGVDAAGWNTFRTKHYIAAMSCCGTCVQVAVGME